jgi:hypothetical protein
MALWTERDQLRHSVLIQFLPAIKVLVVHGFQRGCRSLKSEWSALMGSERAPIFGTIAWLFQEYRRSKAYLEKVSLRSRPDYERTMRMIEGIVTKKGDRLSDRKIKSVSPISADKIYEKIIAGQRGERLRQGEKAVALCRRAWRVVHRLHPSEFDRQVPNPWDGVTMKRRTKAKKSGGDARSGL